MSEETATAATTTDTSVTATPAAPVAADQSLLTAGVVEGSTETKEATGEETSKSDGKPAVPDVYEFKASEGMTLDQGAITLVTPVLKELGVSQEGAQKLADTFVQIQAQQLATQSARWLEQARADKQIGGTAFDANAKIAQQAFANYATPELKSFLDSTGLGNHPELLKAFVAIGKASQQDTHVTADASTSPVDIAHKLFPTMKK